MKRLRFEWSGTGLRTVRSIARRWSLTLALFVGTSILASGMAHAGEWGCQVLLCLSNPGGPEQFGPCVPPIEKLWSGLRHGDPFPTCDFGVGGSRGTSAANVLASGAYCREDFLYWGGRDRTELRCRASGAVDVKIDRRLYTRVWWGVSGSGQTVTEFYGAGSTQIPYDPSQASIQFLRRSRLQNTFNPGGQ